MKHLLVLLVLLLVVYGSWQLTAPLMRRHSLHRYTRHALRLGAVVLALLALLAIAYRTPAIPLL